MDWFTDKLKKKRQFSDAALKRRRNVHQADSINHRLLIFDFINSSLVDPIHYIFEPAIIISWAYYQVFELDFHSVDRLVDIAAVIPTSISSFPPSLPSSLSLFLFFPLPLSFFLSL